MFSATGCLCVVLPSCIACSAYESFNAAVGLLGIYNDSILTEHHGQQQQDAAKWAFWLAAVEQVGTNQHTRVALAAAVESTPQVHSVPGSPSLQTPRLHVQ